MTPTNPPLEEIRIPQPEQVKIVDFAKLISALIGFVLILSGLAMFLYLIYGGWQWLTSGGDKGAIEKAQGRIAAALVGLLIVVSAWAIMTLIERFFGICIISCPIKLPEPFVETPPAPGS